MSNIRYFYNRCPHSNKKELAEWASNYFKEPSYKFNGMKKDQLYAIWYSNFKRICQHGAGNVIHNRKKGRKL